MSGESASLQGVHPCYSSQQNLAAGGRKAFNIFFIFFKSFYPLHPQHECKSAHGIRKQKAFLSSSVCESREKRCFGFQASSELHLACLVRFAAQISLTARMPLGVAWILEVLIASSADG